MRLLTRRSGVQFPSGPPKHPFTTKLQFSFNDLMLKLEVVTLKKRLFRSSIHDYGIFVKEFSVIERLDDEGFQSKKVSSGVYDGIVTVVKASMR